MKRVHVPHDIRVRVSNRIEQAYRAAEAHYGRKFERPEILFDKSGTTAGTANWLYNRVNFNSVLLMENTDRFIARTVPHECGHLICAAVYPETKGGLGKKADAHGYRWQEVMRVLGVPEDEITRLHSYDVSNSKKNVDNTRHAYKCLSCGADITLTAKRHTMFVNGTKKYICAKCKGPIAKVDNIKLKMIGSMPVVHVKMDPKPNAGKMGPRGETKLARCWAMFNQYPGYSRQDMIAVFVNECDCTWAGAGTYYAQCQKLKREGYL